MARQRVGVWDLSKHLGQHQWKVAKGLHAGTIPTANLSEAMGHMIEVYLMSDACLEPNVTADRVVANI